MKSLITYMLFILALSLSLSGCHSFKTLPDGLSFNGTPFVTEDIAFVSDATWVDVDGQRHIQQAIFDDVLRIIAGAKKLIVIDMFLYNDFQGPVPETTRAIAKELTDALIAKKLEQPEINIVVITDPVNTLYGGLSSPYFDQLRAANIRVVITDLHQLRDSNAAYSVLWRMFIKPFGNKESSTLANPIGQGRVSLRSYLELVNFKANHRKILVADQGNNYVGFVSSANPHDGSSAHRNAAIRFTGPAVADLIRSENAVLALSGEPPIAFNQTIEPLPIVKDGRANTTLRVVTEGSIKESILFHLNRAGAGDRVDLMMFYLSDRDVIEALKQARLRGAKLRVLLDPNKDAFGREKNGIPNRPVAHELVDSNIAVRWCRTQGEQCHTKMLIVHETNEQTVLIAGSANFTRRNLDNFNLETNVVVEGLRDKAPFKDAIQYFDDQWSNTADRYYSVDYSEYEDRSWWHHGLYRFMEWSGISTF